MQSIKNYFTKNVVSYAKTHKIITAIAVIAIIGGGYATIKAVTGGDGETQYMLSRVTKGDIETTVSGTGQVAATNQIELRAKASGDITSVSAKAGQTMKAGQLIATVDTKDIAISLQSARLSLKKLTKPAEQSSVLSSKNSLASAEQQKLDAEADVLKAYESAKISLATAYIDVPDVVASVDDLFYDASGFLNDRNSAVYESIGRNYRDDAGVAFDNAAKAIENAQNNFRSNTNTNDQDRIEKMIDETYAATSKLADALKKAKIAVDSIKNSMTAGQNVTAATTAQTNVSSWTTKVNAKLNDLLSAKAAIQSAKNSVVSAQRTIAERKEGLSDTLGGADELDIQSQQLNVRQKELEYADYFIRAPFDGVLASLNIKKGDSSSDTIGTFITKQKVAEITLNEIDAANIVVGQPATLTFDAVDNLSATGTVASIDLVGTVTQGVVNYTAKIAFDVADERIKPGMSVTATIITSSKKDVILVPSAAVKTQGNNSYVEIADFAGQIGGGMRNGTSTATSTYATTTGSSTRGFAGAANRTAMQPAVTLPTAPTRAMVQVGVTNNTQTEILSGLAEGQFVVTKTVTGSSTTATPQSGSLFNMGGGNRTGSTRALQGGAGPR